MINLMLQGRQPIIYGDGEQKRAFSFVDDVVDPLLKMGFDRSVVGEAINVGPDEEYTCVSINELARKVAVLIGFKNLKPVYVADRPMEVKMAYCSAEKARRLLGYRTSTNLDDGLVKMVEWIRRRGTKPFEYHLPLELITDRTPATWKDRLF